MLVVVAGLVSQVPQQIRYCVCVHRHFRGVCGRCDGMRDQVLIFRWERLWSGKMESGWCCADFNMAAAGREAQGRAWRMAGRRHVFPMPTNRHPASSSISTTVPPAIERRHDGLTVPMCSLRSGMDVQIACHDPPIDRLQDLPASPE